MRIITTSEAQMMTARALGLSSAYSVRDVEFLATFLRTAASLNCPTTRPTLVQAAASLLRPFDSDDELTSNIYDGFDELLSYGDLVEIRNQEDTRDLVTLAVPTAVKVSERRIVLLGIAPGGVESLPPPLWSMLTLKGYARILSTVDADAVMSQLLTCGYGMLSYEEWGRTPKVLTPEALIGRYSKLMPSDQSVGSLGELELLLPDTNVRFYRGRWKLAKAETGIFVARRSRRFGSPLWCLVRLEDGIPTGLVNFPTQSAVRGCDEAWHLQQAIDYTRANPQQFSVRYSDDGSAGFLDFFSPVPEWAQRRWLAVGEPADRKGALITFRFDSSISPDEIKFAERRMWVKLS